MTSEEKKLLKALAAMSDQYLSGHTDRPKGFLSHEFMTAGEWCIECLTEYGLVESEHGGGMWTQAGLDFLQSVYKNGF